MRPRRRAPSMRRQWRTAMEPNASLAIIWTNKRSVRYVYSMNNIPIIIISIFIRRASVRARHRHRTKRFDAARQIRHTWHGPTIFPHRRRLPLSDCRHNNVSGQTEFTECNSYFCLLNWLDLTLDKRKMQQLCCSGGYVSIQPDNSVVYPFELTASSPKESAANTFTNYPLLLSHQQVSHLGSELYSIAARIIIISLSIKLLTLLASLFLSLPPTSQRISFRVGKLINSKVCFLLD